MSDSSIRDEWSWKRSLLVRSEILKMVFNSLTVNDKYSNHCRKNFVRPIQTQLSKKLKAFFSFFT